MRILITRPQRDAIGLAEKLQNMGHDPIVESIIRIEKSEDIRSEFNEVLKSKPQAFIITSANAVHSLVGLTKRRDLPILAVGDISAHTAKKYGFADVKSAASIMGGNVNILVSYIKKHYQPEDGSMVHLAGSKLAGKLKYWLGQKGFDVRRITLYDAVAIADFSDSTINSIKKNNIDAVLLYSARTAQIFLELSQRAEITQNLQNIDAHCLSQQVADVFQESKIWQNINIAPFPTESALLGTLGK